MINHLGTGYNWVKNRLMSRREFAFGFYHESRQKPSIDFCWRLTLYIDPEPREDTTTRVLPSVNVTTVAAEHIPFNMRQGHIQFKNIWIVMRFVTKNHLVLV